MSKKYSRYESTTFNRNKTKKTTNILIIRTEKKESLHILQKSSHHAKHRLNTRKLQMPSRYRKVQRKGGENKWNK